MKLAPKKTPRPPSYPPPRVVQPPDAVPTHDQDNDGLLEQVADLKLRVTLQEEYIQSLVEKKEEIVDEVEADVAENEQRCRLPPMKGSILEAFCVIN